MHFGGTINRRGAWASLPQNISRVIPLRFRMIRMSLLGARITCNPHTTRPLINQSSCAGGHGVTGTRPGPGSWAHRPNHSRISTKR
jgi:hypothetical protein